MQETPIATTHYQPAGLFPPKPLILIIILLAFAFFFAGCSSLAPYRQQKILSGEEIQNIRAEAKAQAQMVSEFYFTGQVSIDGWILDRSADILIAGNREPLKLKMEITHSWGKPLFYLLIRDNRLTIIDFMEKRQYDGEFTAANLSRFLPEMDFSPDMIWSFLRGYPIYSGEPDIHEDRGGVLTLKGADKKTIGTITLTTSKEIKEAALFSPGSPGMIFKGFIMAGEISYAANTLLKDKKENRGMTLKRKKVAFNKDIPDEIFTLAIMPSFKQVSLDDVY
ncbi:MAG: hypothetical protein GX654_03175 [Desulfatiglans sp.]|nr:hypothetical protein [Desulfatiglans sp.]